MSADGAAEEAAADDDSDAAVDAAAGCGLFEIISPIVSVVDAKTGDAICDATLVGSSNDSLEPCFGNDGCTAQCQYTVAELTGSSTATFQVTIGAPGYAAVLVPELTPTACGCDAGACQSPQQVTVPLTALDAGSVADSGASVGDAAREGGSGHDAAHDSGSIADAGPG